METIRIQLGDMDVLTSRDTGLSFRVTIEQALETAESPVILDFSHVRNATQSCLDEMVGVLVHQHGLDVLDRLCFHGCNPLIRSLIEFVVADRLSE